MKINEIFCNTFCLFTYVIVFIINNKKYQKLKTMTETRFTVTSYDVRKILENNKKSKTIRIYNSEEYPTNYIVVPENFFDVVPEQEQMNILQFILNSENYAENNYLIKNTESQFSVVAKAKTLQIGYTSADNSYDVFEIKQYPVKTK